MVRFIFSNPEIERLTRGGGGGGAESEGENESFIHEGTGISPDTVIFSRLHIQPSGQTKIKYQLNIKNTMKEREREPKQWTPWQ